MTEFFAKINLTKQTLLKRIDLQGVYDDRVDTLIEFYEDCLSTLWNAGSLSDEDFDNLILKGQEDNVLNFIISEIKTFADIYEYEFQILITNPDTKEDSFINLMDIETEPAKITKRINLDNESYLKNKYDNTKTLFITDGMEPNGLDLVAYDISKLDVRTPNEFHKFISDNGLDEESYEMDRVTLIEVDL